VTKRILKYSDFPLFEVVQNGGTVTVDSNCFKPIKGEIMNLLDLSGARLRFWYECLNEKVNTEKVELHLVDAGGEIPCHAQVVSQVDSWFLYVVRESHK